MDEDRTKKKLIPDRWFDTRENELALDRKERQPNRKD